MTDQEILQWSMLYEMYTPFMRAYHGSHEQANDAIRAMRSQLYQQYSYRTIVRQFQLALHALYEREGDEDALQRILHILSSDHILQHTAFQLLKEARGEVKEGGFNWKLTPDYSRYCTLMLVHPNDASEATTRPILEYMVEQVKDHGLFMHDVTYERYEVGFHCVLDTRDQAMIQYVMDHTAISSKNRDKRLPRKYHEVATSWYFLVYDVDLADYWRLMPLEDNWNIYERSRNGKLWSCYREEEIIVYVS